MLSWYLKVANNSGVGLWFQPYDLKCTPAGIHYICKAFFHWIWWINSLQKTTLQETSLTSVSLTFSFLSSGSGGQGGHLSVTPAMAPRPLPQGCSPSPPTIAQAMAPYDGTQQWDHVHCTLQWHPGATSNPPSGSWPSRPIGRKNPYSYHYLGNGKKCKSYYIGTV